jgi:hypothetical protein
MDGDPLVGELIAPPAIGSADERAAEQAWAAQQAASSGSFTPACTAMTEQRPFDMCNAIIGSRYHLVHGIGRGKFGK